MEGNKPNTQGTVDTARVLWPMQQQWDRLY